MIRLAWIHSVHDERQDRAYRKRIDCCVSRGARGILESEPL